MRDYRRTLDRILSPHHRPGGIKARPGKRSWVNNNQLLEDLSTSLVRPVLSVPEALTYQHSSAGDPVSGDYYLDWDRSTRQADGCAATITGDNPYTGLRIIYDWGVQDSDMPVLLVDVTRDNQFRREVPVPKYLWTAGWVACGATEVADEVDRDICVRQFADWVLETVRNVTPTESYALNIQLDRILNELDGGAGACGNPQAGTMSASSQAAGLRGTDIIAEDIVQVMRPVGIIDQHLIIEDREADSVDLEAAVAKLKHLTDTVDAPEYRHPGVDITK